MKRAIKTEAFDHENVYLASSIPLRSVSMRRRGIRRLQFIKLKNKRMKYDKYISSQGILRNMLLLAFMSIGVTSFAQENVEDSDIYTGKADVTATQQIVLKPGFRAMKGCDVHVYIDASANYTPITYSPTPNETITTSFPSSSFNYIHNIVLRESITDTTATESSARIETYDYYDGLGRLSQRVNVQGSPDKKDLVQHISYDNFGRRQYQYLPYQASVGTGAYASSAAGDTEDFYSSGFNGHSSDSNAKTESLYENSPLNRITGTRSPGSNWENKATSITYSTNTEVISHWDENGNPLSFAANELYVTKTVDEDGHLIREYKDKLGQVVLTEVFDGTQWLRTHYIYDDFGLLRCVVPPLASSPENAELCYFYTYDGRRRMIVTDLPGASPVYLVYDNRDRLVLTQDGNQSGQQWLATIYDWLNRPVITALITNADDPVAARGNFESQAVNATFSATGEFFGYAISLPSGYTLTKEDIQTVTWYDDYSFLAISDFLLEDYTYRTPNLAGDATLWSSQKGQVTGTFTRVMQNTEVVTDNLLLSVNYYDLYGRVVENISDNHLGGKDISYFLYNFTGQPEKTVLNHQVPGQINVKMTTLYAYDHQGRLLTEKIQMDDQNEITITANKYNEIGELQTRYLHGSSSGSDFNQQVDYRYNIRGWLRSLNQPESLGSDLFALDLQYEDPDQNSLITLPCFNGNISQMRWQAYGQQAKGYAFYYDYMDRLKSTVYAEGEGYEDGIGNNNTYYEYDQNGNITYLKRYKNGSSIDELTYSYSNGTNQLFSVIDEANNVDGYAAATGNYTYDADGNMNYDPSKSFSLNYNYLNLPSSITNPTSEMIHYTYTASGAKLAKTVSGSVYGNTLRMDYCGPFLYEDNKLKCIFTSAGRIVTIEDGSNVLYKYEYNLQDHLGNVRVTFGGHTGGKPELVQCTDYYPFGLVIDQRNYIDYNAYPDNEVLVNKYLYNNKELQDDELAGTKLGWYDYGRRFYDPALARFHTVDPKATDYYFQSPYTYAANNPIKYIDKNGENPVVIVGGVVLTVADIALISAGVITTGIILQKTADGSLGWSQGMQDLMGRTRIRSKSKTDNFKSQRKSNLTNKQQTSRDNKPPYSTGGALESAVMFKALELYINSKETTDVGHDEFKPENYVEKRDEDANKKQDSSSNKSTTNTSEENKEENKPVIKPKEDEKERNQ